MKQTIIILQSPGPHFYWKDGCNYVKLENLDKSYINYKIIYVAESMEEAKLWYEKWIR